jgi:DNA-binding MarR family transcriptional regulator
MSPDDPASAIPIPALLRHARGAFSLAIRANLREGGFEDLPTNGPYVLGGMANQQVPTSQLLRELGTSKQAASQLVDTLVVRGYLTRQVDPSDRRRMTLALTERGIAAAVAVRDGVRAVDSTLAERLSPEELSSLRRGLFELISVKEELEDAGRSGSGGEFGAV